MLFKKVSAKAEVDYAQHNISTKKPFNWGKFWANLKNDSLGWGLILPTMIFFIIFLWHPIYEGVRLSFFRTQGWEGVEFIGLENFGYVMKNSLFLKTLGNTCKYTFWSLALGTALPIVTAIILNEMTFMKSFFRMAVYFPCLIPGIVTSVMWKIMLEPGEAGLFNTILYHLGKDPLPWLQNPSWTIPLIVLTGTWGGFGSNAILYLADLQSVNVDLYEAASLDGAGFWKRVWHITLPHMSGLIKMLLIMQIIGVFQTFQQPLAMTGGGPNNASMPLMMLSYRYAFEQFNMGRSTAVSVFTMVILIIFTIIYLKLGKSADTE